MGRNQRILTTVLWGLLVLGMVGVIGAGLWRTDASTAGEAPDVTTGDLPVYFDAPSFALVNQDNEPVTSDALRGRPWIAAFIFTQCAGPCPMMTAHMARLQDAIKAPEVMLVSFSVDPERDTPEVLKEYAANFSADESRWHFLTGERDAIYAAAAGMKVAAQPAADGSDIIHSTKLLLVDPQGRVRGIYSSTDEADLEQLASDAERLVE